MNTRPDTDDELIGGRFETRSDLRVGHRDYKYAVLGPIRCILTISSYSPCHALIDKIDAALTPDPGTVADKED